MIYILLKPLYTLNKNITEFLGIPYALPQTSVGRFMPPVAINSSFPEDFKNSHFENGSYQATTPANTCPQYIYKTNFSGNDFLLPTNNITEDCLQLNMWLPDNEYTTRSKNFSVIVFIHGGSFATGSGSLDPYNASILAANQSVIVITLNYRVGPLGFAYFGEDTDVKGNMGLLDQQIALKWIYENIGYFNGSNKKITIFGHSAGAASVTAHLLSENSHSYFSKIIVNSGAITNVWATISPRAALNNTLWLASIMNCTEGMNVTNPETLNKTAIILCMQKANSTDLNDNQFTTRDVEQPPLPYTYLPIYNDTVFFNGSLFEKLKNGKTKKNYSALYGRVSEEGSYFLPFLLGEDYGCGFNHTLGSDASINQCTGIWRIVLYFSWFKLGGFFNATFWANSLLGTLYTMDTRSSNRDKAIQIFGDFMFNCDTAQFAEISDINCTKKSYYFEFQKRSTINPWPQWMGVMHGYELEYVFGMPFRYPQNYSNDVLEYEQKYATRVMGYYGAFTKLETPHLHWDPFKSRSQNKCNFDNDKCAIIGDGLTSDNIKKFNYTKVITKKCYQLNRVANDNPPRFKLENRLYNHDEEEVKKILDNGFLSDLWW
uniref:Acetylcholinesterase n=1 Tax=Parastrongyloides trichosuri TaxID=131310 RepID=A0A0N4ZKX9_PARTI